MLTFQSKPKVSDPGVLKIGINTNGSLEWEYTWQKQTATAFVLPSKFVTKGGPSQVIQLLGSYLKSREKGSIDLSEIWWGTSITWELVSPGLTQLTYEYRKTQFHASLNDTELYEIIAILQCFYYASIPIPPA